MTRRVLLVRAVNVGGTAKLPMADFRSILEELGAKNVRTYIASGNACIEVPDPWSPGQCEKFDRSVENEIEARFGFRREVISRSTAELEATLAEHPFAVDNPKWSYVTFLVTPPDQEALDRAAQLPTGADEWKVMGKHLHLRFAGGMGAAKLDSAALLKRLAVIGTGRNLSTVRALIDLARTPTDVG